MGRIYILSGVVHQTVQDVYEKEKAKNPCAARVSTVYDMGAVIEYDREVMLMDELRSLIASLNYQRRRLRELVEISGREDPDHPLQRYSIQRIEWLEKKIEQLRA